MPWQLYIIETASGKLYTGITTNLSRRLKEHGDGPKGARFFNFSKPEKIVYCEEHPNRSEASKREQAIKKMSRSEKLTLVAHFSSKQK